MFVVIRTGAIKVDFYLNKNKIWIQNACVHVFRNQIVELGRKVRTGNLVIRFI